jgi:hypothetical protein
MLSALETGVKGGIWFSLIDKMYAERSLRAAMAKVVANHGAPGIDHVTVEAFAEAADANLAKLQQAVRDGSYKPQALRRAFNWRAGCGKSACPVRRQGRLKSISLPYPYRSRLAPRDVQTWPHRRH